VSSAGATGPDESSRRAVAAWLGGIVLLGFAIRLAALWAIAETPLVGDEREYFGRALYLVQNGSMMAKGIRPPLMDLYYAALFQVAGPSIFVARFGNVLLGSLCLLPIFYLGRQWGGDRVGLASAAVAGLYPNLVAFSHYLWSETLYLLIVLGAISLLVWQRERPALGKAFAAGAVLGLGALTREVGAIFPPFAACWLVWIARPQLRAGLAASGAMAVAFLLVVLPWTLQIQQERAPFALLSRTTYMNLYIGNAPSVETADGRTLTPWQNFWTLGKTRIQAEKKARRLALEAIRERMPGWPLEKLTSELPHFFTPTSLAVRRLQMEPEAPEPDRRWAYLFRFELGQTRAFRLLAVAAIVTSYVPLVVLGTGGLVLARQRELASLFALFIGSQILPTIVTFAASRFRLPSMALLIVSAVGVVAARPDAPRRRRVAALLAMAAVLALVLVGWREPLTSDWG